MQKATDLLAGNMKRSVLIVICISIAVSASVGPVHAQPVVTVLQATDITDTSARLEGFVNPNGQDTEWYFFVWTDAPGPHNNNNINCPSPPGHLPGSDAIDPVSCTVQVDPSTTYSFVLVAKWSGGQSATSNALQFTTLSPIVIVTATMMSFQTDWALSNPTMSPAHPKVGDRVTFAVTLTALSSNVGYPQTVRYTFALDGTHVFFDEALYDYPGPTGNPIRLEAGIDPREVWLATSGSHMVEWTVEPVIVGLIVTDPNMANNHVSLPFSVGPADVGPTGSALDILVVPATRTVTAGGSATFTVTVPYIPCIPPDCATITLTSYYWFIGTGTMTVTFSPSQYTFTATRSDFISTMSVNVDPSVPAGSYNIEVIATSDIPARTKSITVTVEVTTATTTSAGPVFGFNIALSPGSLEVKQGETAYYDILLTYSDPSYSGTDVKIQVSGLGSGMDWHLTTSGVAVETSPTTSTGTYTITATGSAVGVTRQASATLVVTSGQPSQAGGFRLDAFPDSLTVNQGETGSYSVGVVGVEGFNSVVSLAVSGLPSGATGVLSAPSGTPDFSSTLTVTVPRYAPTGSFTLTITGTGGGLTKIANVVLIVKAAKTTLPPATQTTTTVSRAESGLPDLTWIMIGILAVLIVVFAAFALRRRRPAPPPAPPSSEQPAPPAAAEKPAPLPLYCVHCGTGNPPTNEYCGKCGEKLLRAS